MSDRRNPGSTNVEVELQILDNGTFLPRTDFVWNSAGIDLNYRRQGEAVSSITEASLASLTTAHTDGGFIHVQNGRYRLDLPDAACASGVDHVTVGGTITGGVVIPRTILLDYADVNVAQISTDAREEVADTVWDEATSGHNVAGSYGKAVRQLKEGTVSEESTVNDGSPSATGFVTALTETTNNYYKDVSVVFTDGNLVGQSRPILSYNGSTKTLTFDEAFTEAPASGDSFIIKTDHVHPISTITSDFLNTQMTESYAADGVAPTIAQSLFLIQQSLGDFSISGGTLTVKKLDGSTTAASFTLSPTGNPTSTTRAS